MTAVITIEIWLLAVAMLTPAVGATWVVSGKLNEQQQQINALAERMGGVGVERRLESIESHLRGGGK